MKKKVIISIVIFVFNKSNVYNKMETTWEIVAEGKNIKTECVTDKNRG